MTSRPIHGQIDRPEGPLKLAEGHFPARAQCSGNRIARKLTLGTKMVLSELKRAFWPVDLAMDRPGGGFPNRTDFQARSLLQRRSQKAMPSLGDDLWGDSPWIMLTWDPQVNPGCVP